jgi:hypothetical protein
MVSGFETTDGGARSLWMLGETRSPEGCSVPNDDPNLGHLQNAAAPFWGGRVVRRNPSLLFVLSDGTTPGRAADGRPGDTGEERGDC